MMRVSKPHYFRERRHQQTWRDFALLYLQVVSDCPITLPGLTHLKKVELKAKSDLSVSIMGQNY
jgi:hypothetical protein